MRSKRISSLSLSQNAEPSSVMYSQVIDGQLRRPADREVEEVPEDDLDDEGRRT